MAMETIEMMWGVNAAACVNLVILSCFLDSHTASTSATSRMMTTVQKVYTPVLPSVFRKFLFVSRYWKLVSPTNLVLDGFSWLTLYRLQTMTLMIG